MLLYGANEGECMYMKDTKYVVCRDHIYVGEVIRYCSEDVFKSTGFLPRNLELDGYFSYRSMLFVPDEKNLSNDLLYQSPPYPILDITDDDLCLYAQNNENIVIQNAYNLAPLLEYFGYDKELSYEDIMMIRKVFFTDRFFKDHSRLFGYKEQISQIGRSKFKIFTEMDEHLLPREYFDVLDDLGDNSFWYSFCGLGKRNVFTPDKHEGSIKKLSKR